MVGVEGRREDTEVIVIGEEDTVTWERPGPDTSVVTVARLPKIRKKVPVGDDVSGAPDKDMHVVELVSRVRKTFTFLLPEIMDTKGGLVSVVKITVVTQIDTLREGLSYRPLVVLGKPRLVTPLR